MENKLNLFFASFDVKWPEAAMLHATTHNYAISSVEHTAGCQPEEGSCISRL